jgi:signal transduction histidine kinase
LRRQFRALIRVAHERQVDWAAGFALALVVTVWSHWSQLRDYPFVGAAYSLIGLGWLGTAWLLWRQREQASNARLFLVLSITWMFGEVARLDIPGLYEVSLFVAQYPHILCAGLLLRYPKQRFDRASWIFVTSGLALTTLFAIPSALVAPGPEHSGDGPGRVLSSIGPYHFNDFQSGKFIFWIVYAVIFIVMLVSRWRRLTGFERSTLAPILVSAVLVTVAVSTSAIDLSLSPAAMRALRVARALTGVGISAAFVVSALRLRLARGSVADLVERLSGRVSEQSIRDALVAVFGDPSIEVVAWDPQLAARLAQGGRLVLPVPGSHDQPLALAQFSSELRRHVPLLRSHLAACGLALENSRQLKAVQDAQARIVQAGIGERRRLERDLHDGAQQRLLGLGLRLGALEARSSERPGDVQAIRGLRAELRMALQELRDLAHGIYPSVLVQAGLGPALESVVERLSEPFALSVPDRRWDRDVENAVYLVACEAISNVVKHAGPCQARIEIREKPGFLELRVADTGVGFRVEDVSQAPGEPLLRTVSDRLAALGGQVDVTSEVGAGTSIVARVPLAPEPA